MNTAQKNIKKLYFIAACTGIVFYYALDKVFMQARGLSLTEMVVIEIIYSAIVVLTEVPSGALSDRWSRKYVLALNSLFFALNTIVWAVSHSFWLFVLGVVFGALHSTFQSGTNTSLLYDSLREMGRESQYARYLGKTRAITAIAFIFAAIVGGAIGQRFGTEATFWCTLPFTISAGFTALGIYEPRFHRSTGEISYWKHINKTFNHLVVNPKIIHMAMILVAITIPALLFDEYAQLYFSFVGVSIFGLGVLAAVNGGIDALFNTFAHSLARFRHDVLFSVCMATMGLGFIVAGTLSNTLGIPLLFIGASAFFIVAILAESDINVRLASSIRATSESFFSLAEKLIYIPIALAFAWIGQHYSISVAFTWLGVAVLIYLCLFLIFSRKHVRQVGGQNHQPY